MTPSLGQIVILIGPAATGNGTDHAPAIINRVWSESAVNVTAFPDCGSATPATSVPLFADEETARAWLAEEPYRSTAAYWPARV